VREARGNTLASFIMKRITDDIVNEAYEEADSELNQMRSQASLEKKAIDFSITPASVVGSLVGSLVARKMTHEDIMRKKIEEDNTTVLRGNYYSQVQNLTQNLKIIFTPFGVVYSVKNGGREITIETIATEEMNAGMYMAWQQKDTEFYKHLLLNKMMTEIQFAEQQFAKNLIQKQIGLKNQLSKKASIEIDTEDMTLFETIDYIDKMRNLYSKNTEATEKLAEALIKSMDEEVNISWTFQRPVEKYAFLANPLSFLGINIGGDGISSLQGDNMSPSHLANKVKIGFLPDRVVFAVDNRVITSLLVMDMNQEGFEAFEKQSQPFFKKYFEKEAKKGILRSKGKLPPNSSRIEKKAKDIDTRDIFLENDVHPQIYLDVLNKKYGDEWLEWDTHSLVSVLEDDFNLENGISDIPLNKIFSILSVNVSDVPFTSHHAFEKCIRAFNNKPIDFMKREDDITPLEMIFGIDAMDRVTPNDNIYDNFSSEVFNYTIKVLSNSECKLFFPSNIMKSELQEEFYGQLNKYLLDEANERDTVHVYDDKIESSIMQTNEAIWKLSKIALSVLRKHENITEKEIDSSLESVKGNLKLLIKKQVTLNVNMDKFLDMSSKQYESQKNLYLRGEISG
jgi:hypothetical protein